MAAFLKAEFDRGFFLSAEGVVKIDEIIRKRVDGGTPYQLSYRVYRNDGMVLSLGTTGEVIDEENSSRNAVQQLSFQLRSESSELDLSFEKGESTKLSIMSESRDTAYLMSSDLKEYLNTEVLKFGSWNFNKIFSSRTFMPIVLMISMVFMFATMLFVIKDSDPTSALNSTSLEVKLNYLISRRAELPSSSFMSLIFIAPLFGAVALGLLASSLAKQWPRDVFFWGKQVSIYEKAKGVKDKIVWTVVVGFIVSVGAAYFLKFMGETP